MKWDLPPSSQIWHCCAAFPPWETVVLLPHPAKVHQSPFSDPAPFRWGGAGSPASLSRPFGRDLVCFRLELQCLCRPCDILLRLSPLLQSQHKFCSPSLGFRGRIARVPVSPGGRRDARFPSTLGSSQIKRGCTPLLITFIFSLSFYSGLPR